MGGRPSSTDDVLARNGQTLTRTSAFTLQVLPTDTTAVTGRVLTAEAVPQPIPGVTVTLGSAFHAHRRGRELRSPFATRRRQHAVGRRSNSFHADGSVVPVRNLID